ncbi:aldose 1-epimerase [Siccirubricoccus deserti]|uniref:Aldose epimerase n=1 Tax=Siccirubricoccus deserti TaxID=2013562 RepID=A0A9X0UC49_9PROT|nr:aldose epimerase [Siccirubricoccus deserti]MBC4014847.1 aldose epimerase [Siccirubricoccus deserti]GGC35516.1 aldose 1-epimerase [Siccirubricoccus deserti]
MAADRVALEAGEWSAALLPAQGGAFAALTWRGIDLLMPLPAGADPNTSFCGAFTMAPWANRLDGGMLPVAGTTYHLPVNRPADGTAIHGLVRDAHWQVEQATPAHVVLTQAMDTAPLGIPWRFTTRLELQLAGGAATLALRLVNDGAQPFPFGLGWHPFFLRPPGTRLHLHATTLFARDARTLPVAAQPTAGIDGDEAAYEGLDTHFAGWDGVATIIRPDCALRIEASGAWAHNLQLFAPAGGKVLCIEPVSHLPDAPNRPALATFGPMTMLLPGESLDARLRLTATR